MTSQKGPFITVEGVDGAGKSTHVQTLVDALTRAGLTVVATREPGGTPLGALLRAQFKTMEMDVQTAALIAFADRNEHLVQKIRPALAAGQAVVSDRFTDSTFAYQGGGDGCPRPVLETLEQLVHADCQPDLTLFFDVSPEVAAARRAQRKAGETQEKPDKFDEKDLAWFAAVREGYHQRIAANPERYVIINADVTIDQVAQQVQQAIGEFLEQRAAPRRAPKP